MSKLESVITEDLSDHTNGDSVSVPLVAIRPGPIVFFSIYSEVLLVNDNMNKIDDLCNDTRCCRKKSELIKKYFQKWSGQHKSNESSIQFVECIITFVGTFIALGIISVVHYRILAEHDLTFLLGSFGASCVLLFATPSSPLAQPRNAVFGQLIGATVGCIVRIIFDYIQEQFIAATLSVAISILIMQLTNTLHAPGGATALTMIMTKTTYPWYGFQYILMPTLSGTTILIIVALIINNLSSKRHYPVTWW
ncbi:unnamed protein product [Adineta steineri]|uniref:HPP transmembrane region domain-containing protein n=2 Tax=Adineta steineri TaxID=433720 RepID=A0A813WT34_9BILA|nr:unnamed protein product [Adineta steineri]